MNKREQILTLAREIPIFSTDTAAKFFLRNGSPSKRASEILRELEEEKLLEGERRAIGKSKVWRLSSKGRKMLGVTRRPVPFNTPKMEHILGMGSIFADLFLSDRLAFFVYEPQDKFYEGREMVYAPDAFFILKDPYKAYLLEFQRSALSSARWAAKWNVSSLFFEEAYKSASWQVLQNKILRPGILVLSEQPPEIVNPGDFSYLTISKNIQAIL